jgi:hypothetical protein
MPNFPAGLFFRFPSGLKYPEFLKKFEIDFDEKYLFEWYD